MDPLSLVSAVVGITAACLKTAMALDNLRSKYKLTSIVIASLCSQCAIISLSMTKLQSVILKNRQLQHRPELQMTLDTALTSCLVIFSCLDREIQSISVAGSRFPLLGWMKKTKYIWNEDTLKEYLSQIHGQQNTINFLLQLLQMQSLDQILREVHQNRRILEKQADATRSLRANHSEVDVPESIFEDRNKVITLYDAISTISATKFVSDNDIVTSKVYRKVLEMARAGNGQENPTQTLQIEAGDLIDLAEECHDLVVIPTRSTLEEEWTVEDPSLNSVPEKVVSASTSTLIDEVLSAPRNNHIGAVTTVRPLTVEPPTIETGPSFTNYSIKNLLLTNTNPMNVAFKFYTTNPTYYNVKPAHGTIGAGAKFIVQIVPLPISRSPPLKNKAKLVVRSMASTEDTISRDEDPKSIQTTNIRIIFRDPITVIPNNNIDCDS